ncbi:hypothetical protein PYH37_002446 [Sinorhizobium numidicum]|uniref:Uncharacterized protein n=1 Tax=Sinorhizobium numidicum TaxID=680248 RepID=A0ABY8D0C2_9HYPH|nr:hypothetical protein [Sinorhizobium numidicum]WEX77634.1 hypothetical protein PYH37_002446 [Sinorhizobium numidicum]WEX84294.1 hypothetical protein PYH38_003159 [Sinorhizobium numidicum]
MIPIRSIPALSLAALFLGATADAGLAHDAVLQLAQTYHDLPGVLPEAPLRESENVVCEQIFVDRYAPFESSRGPRYDTVYKCRRGDGPVFQGSRLPPSLERQKRGLNY